MFREGATIGEDSSSFKKAWRKAKVNIPYRVEILVLCFLVSIALTAWMVWRKENKIFVLVLILLCSGISLNLLVVIVNGGKMPVALSASDTRDAAIIAESYSWMVMNETTRLKVLGDWIPIPAGERKLMLSPGDLFLFVTSVIGALALFYYCVFSARKKFFKKE